jgi:hypothetical protein
MVYSVAPVSATVAMIGDYFHRRRLSWLLLHQKGGKRHEVSCHPHRGLLARQDDGGRNQPRQEGKRAMFRFDLLHMIRGARPFKSYKTRLGTVI